ncbi:hypothetical protein LCGC14_1374500 [marine sediment metagenome]|uniref:Histone H1 n=1 Tax=marine sediment metagenome TaxID=412755 RepID=A0A0F9MJL9_9ZZZZ
MAKKDPDTPTPEELKKVATYLSRLGASKGGKARARKLSKRRRVEIAKKAIKTRWERVKKLRKKGQKVLKNQ